MRRNLEGEALRQFAGIANEMGLEVFSGQRRGNRLALSGKNYFQFGDLRVETDNRIVLVEAESAGGVTNLTKYWYWIGRVANQDLMKPVALIHIFRQNSARDYAAHLELWDFLAQQASKDLGAKFTAYRYCYRDVGDLVPALDKFRRLIDDGWSN